MKHSPWWIPVLSEPYNHCYKLTLKSGFLMFSWTGPGIIILSFSLQETIENVMGMCLVNSAQIEGTTFRVGWLGLSPGPALPSAWIIISKTQWSWDTDARQPVARQKRESIERLEMLVVISFAGVNPSSSTSKWRRGVFPHLCFFN